MTKVNQASISDLLNEASFSIPVSSLNSRLELRDERIKTHVFGVLGVNEITGELTHGPSGDLQATIQLGEVYHSIPITADINDQSIEIKASLNLLDWKAQSALETLNQVCEVVHIGPDGISKLWPDVDINIKLPIQVIE